MTPETLAKVLRSSGLLSLDSCANFQTRTLVVERNLSSLRLDHVLGLCLFTDWFLVLTSLGYFSHITVTSRHHTYRQSHTLILSPSTCTLTASTRTTVGTTVQLKELFANYPVRLSSSRSNRQSELTELHKITTGIGLTGRLALSVRTCTGEKIVKIDRFKGKDSEKNVIETSFTCSVSPWTMSEDQLDGVRITVKFCLANTSKNHLFVCILTFEPFDLDVNGRYIYNHSLIEELKPSLSKVTAIHNCQESDNLKSTILLLRIASAPQSTLSLVHALNHLLSRICGPSRVREFPSIRSLLETPRQIETKMKSARGLEYSKPTNRAVKKSEVTLGTDTPGVEFNQRVLS